MDVPLLLAEKVVVSAGIGLMIGLEREWAHKEAGTRSFSFAALLGTLAWLVAPALAFIIVCIGSDQCPWYSGWLRCLFSGFHFRNCADRPPFVEDRACHVYQ
jgi:hypothetical protein